MSGAKFSMGMDHKDIVRSLVTAVGDFTQGRLINKQERLAHKEHCAERLAAEDGGSRDSQVRYSDQAVLANLDWGMGALEEAIDTSNVETKLARLDYAEKMLQVCAMLDSSQKTAGVPNFYLSAWSHLYLALLWKLRNNVHKSLLHILDMFIVDPFFSRIDFAPDLWKTMFLPHMSSIVGWYSESRHRLIMEVIPDSGDLSFTVDLDQYCNESIIFSTRPDQAHKLQKLEQLYAQSLDDNTKLYAKYYKDCFNSSSDATASKRVFPMLPIAEPPMTPLHELSRHIPDYVKFGPILPKSAGFSPFLKDERDENDGSGLNEDLEGSAKWSPKESLLDVEFEYGHVDMQAANTRKNNSISASSNKILQVKDKSYPNSPTLFSPTETPQKSTTPSPVNPKTSASSPRRVDNIRTSPTASSDGVKSCKNKFCFGNNSQILLDNNSEEEGSPSSSMSAASSGKLTPLNRPPKDFVCPITGQLLSDPVTLETGQTYERKAIQEWLIRGNTTCPITRQPLSANALPKTNYVLKRLITSWKDQYPDIALEFSYSESTPRTSISADAFPTPPCAVDLSISNIKMNNRFTRQGATVAMSPTSVISQAAAEAIINGIKPYTSCLCTSEDLQECEAAVLAIARIWKDSKGESGLVSYLSKPTIVNGFAEILMASVNRDILRTTVCILSHLMFGDGSVGETLTSVDSDFDGMVALLKNGLVQAVVLIYQLGPSFAQLSAHDLIPTLVKVILNRQEQELDDFQLVIDPKDAAIALLEQVVIGGDENTRSHNALNVISTNGLPYLIKCLDRSEGRRSVVSILLSCMRADRGSTNFVANRVHLAPILELFHSGDDCVRGICIEFLLELACLNRRIFSNRILQTIKDEGACSTMHSFLVYLQMAPMEQQTAIACLLLQLDLLVEPRKTSIYREEAIETLIEALRRKDFPICQIMALNAFASLSGGFTASGKSVAEAWLLKTAGLDQYHNVLLMGQENESVEEDTAMGSWEKRVAFVLCNHENGSIFKALGECLKSSSLDMAKSCFVIATWLVHMLACLPDTGVRETARHCLLDQFINVLQSSRNLEEKALASVALRSFREDQVALKEIGIYAKSICKSLRKLKRSSVVVVDILKALMNLSSINASELWSCAEVTEIDSSRNGEVISLVHLKGRVFSSHSDGTIKVWDDGKRVLRLIQEAREHAKAVTCLCVSSSGDRLYSGSLDKTIRVWAIRSEDIQCVQVHDVKEAVHVLAANTNFACFASQGTGIKIYDWVGCPKQISFNKYVKCLAMTERKLYCGCTGYTIQEVDLTTHTSTAFFIGNKRLLGKQIIHALCIREGFLFVGGSSVDGIAGKVILLENGKIVGSLPSTSDIHYVAVNNDFIFCGTKSGMVDVYLRGRLLRVGSLRISIGVGNIRATSLISNFDGDMLFASSSEGKIQAWILD